MQNEMIQIILGFAIMAWFIGMAVMTDKEAKWQKRWSWPWVILNFLCLGFGGYVILRMLRKKRQAHLSRRPDAADPYETHLETIPSGASKPRGRMGSLIIRVGAIAGAVIIAAIGLLGKNASDLRRLKNAEDLARVSDDFSVNGRFESPEGYSGPKTFNRIVAYLEKANDYKIVDILQYYVEHLEEIDKSVSDTRDVFADMLTTTPVPADKRFTDLPTTSFDIKTGSGEFTVIDYNFADSYQIDIIGEEAVPERLRDMLEGLEEAAWLPLATRSNTKPEGNFTPVLGVSADPEYGVLAMTGYVSFTATQYCIYPNAVYKLLVRDALPYEEEVVDLMIISKMLLEIGAECTAFTVDENGNWTSYSLTPSGLERSSFREIVPNPEFRQQDIDWAELARELDSRQ